MTVFHHVKRDTNSPFVTLYVCLPSVATFAFLRSSYACIMNIGAFCLRMRENHSVRLQMADLLGGCEFCHGFYEKYGLNFCSISQNSC